MRNTWTSSIDALQNSMAFIMLVVGIGLVVVAAYIGTQPCDVGCENAEEAGKGKAVSTTIIGAGFAGALLIVLSVIELSPHLCWVCCNRSQLEVKVGKILFFFYLSLSFI